MMVLSQLFCSSFARFSFLGFAVVATVATSQPAAWSLSDTTEPEHLALAAGAATERTVAYEASEASVQLRIELETFATTGGKVRVVAEGCGLDRTYEQREPKRWYAIDDRGEAGASWYVTPYLSAYCSGKSATVTVRIENVGAAPIACDLSFEATITGPGGDTEAPHDAFVRVRTVR